VLLFLPQNKTKTPPAPKVYMKSQNKQFLCAMRSIFPGNKALPNLPSGKAGVVVHHVGVVPTLALATKQSMAGSGIALRLVLHPCLKDTRVRKIN
jgi:hypothetical protein